MFCNFFLIFGFYEKFYAPEPVIPEMNGFSGGYFTFLLLFCWIYTKFVHLHFTFDFIDLEIRFDLPIFLYLMQF